MPLVILPRAERQVATAPRKQPSTEAQQAAEVPGARQAAGEMQAGRVSAVVGSQPLPGAAPQAAIETVEGVAAAAWQQDSLSCDSEELAEGEIETLAEGMAAYGAGVESGSAALSPRVPTATNRQGAPSKPS